MIKIEWSYLQNPFDNVTKRNYKKMYLMATDHFDKLQHYASGDPAIQELYDFGKEAFSAYTEQYIKSSTDEATYRMHTVLFEEMIADLSGTQIRRWDVAIQGEFDVVRAEYKALLPNGRKPFQSGAYDTRTAEVRSLADRLKAFAALVDLEATVREFGQKMVETRTRQQQGETQIRANSDSLEMSRQALAQVMHGIFGGLVRLNYDNPALVERYYELQYLRSSSSGGSEDDAPRETVTLTVPQQNKTEVLQGRFQVDDVVRVTNTGGAGFAAYLAVDVAADPDATVDVPPGQMITLTATAAGASLVLWNQNDTDSAALVELL